jgi:hypothetical protein
MPVDAGDFRLIDRKVCDALYFLFALSMMLAGNTTKQGSMLGIIGGYIGRIYDETKGRPLYIIGEKDGF